MKLPCKAEKTLKKVCAKKGDARYFIQNPHLDAEKKILWATNGHILSRVPVETSDTDTTGYISLEAIKYAAAVSKATKSASEISANGGLDIGGTSFERPEHKFPAVDQIYDETVAKEPVVTISFNAQLLHDLAASLSECGKAGKVTLNINGPKEAILVTSLDSKEATGLLMPTR